MNILIDIGNTSCKVAFCPAHPSERLAGADVMRFSTQKETLSYVRKRMARRKADTIVLSNVRSRSVYLERMLERMCSRFVNFDEDFVADLLKSKAPAPADPLTVLAHMPLGMGADRMAAIFGAEVLYPLQDKLVFDSAPPRQWSSSMRPAPQTIRRWSTPTTGAAPYLWACAPATAP